MLQNDKKLNRIPEMCKIGLKMRLEEVKVGYTVKDFNLHC